MIELSSEAVADLRRIGRFLDERNPRAAGRAIEAILKSLATVEAFPEMGVRTRIPEIRQVQVGFGRRGYVVRYATKPDRIYITRIWHGRERRPP